MWSPKTDDPRQIDLEEAIERVKATSFDKGTPIDDRGPVQGLSHGRWIHLLDPRPEDIHIEDIANALSNICRFIGHVKPFCFYSVAQHSVMVSRLVPPELALCGLLHDAVEAYTGDMTRPMKVALNTVAPGAYKQIADRIEQAIAKRFHLPWPWPAPIKEADMIAVMTEKRDLLHLTDLDWGPMPEPHRELIFPKTPESARYLFLDRFRYLTERQS